MEVYQDMAVVPRQDKTSQVSPIHIQNWASFKCVSFALTLGGTLGESPLRPSRISVENTICKRVIDWSDVAPVEALNIKY